MSSVCTPVFGALRARASSRVSTASVSFTSVSFINDMRLITVECLILTFRSKAHFKRVLSNAALQKSQNSSQKSANAEYVSSSGPPA